MPSQDFRLTYKERALKDASETVGLMIQIARHLAAKHMNETGLADNRGVLGRWTTEEVSMPPCSLVGFLYAVSRGEHASCPKGRETRWER